MKIFRLQKPVVLLLISSVLFFIPGSGFAQLNQVVTGGCLYSPPSPNASALLRYANAGR